MKTNALLAATACTVMVFAGLAPAAISTDPGWMAQGNRNPVDNGGDAGVSSGVDFGYDAANQRIGGRMDRIGSLDLSYYGKDVGELTFDDPFEFSATVIFDGNNEGQFGFFDRNAPLSEGNPINDTSFLGLQVSANWLIPVAMSRDRPNDPGKTLSEGCCGSPPIVRSLGMNVPLEVSLTYDPTLGDNGRFTFDYNGDGVERVVDISDTMRNSEAVFNTFGLIALSDNGSHGATNAPSNNLWLENVSFTPEPATLGLLTLGGLLLVGRRVRRA